MIALVETGRRNLSKASMERVADALNLAGKDREVLNEAQGRYVESSDVVTASRLEALEALLVRGYRATFPKPHVRFSVSQASVHPSASRDSLAGSPGRAAC